MDNILDLLRNLTKKKFNIKKDISASEKGRLFEEWVINELKESLKFPLHNIDYYPASVIKDIKNQLSDPTITDYTANWIWDEHRDILKQNAIIYQPMGNYNPPDVLILQDFKYLPLECKTSSVGKPKMGATVPKPGFWYLYDNLKRNKMSLISGKDIEHPAYDQKFKVILNDIEKAAGKGKDYLADRRYFYNGQSIKYSLTVRIQYDISCEII